MVFHRRKLLWRYCVVTSIIVHFLLCLSFITTLFTNFYTDPPQAPPLTDKYEETINLWNLTTKSVFAVETSPLNRLSTSLNWSSTSVTTTTPVIHTEEQSWGEVKNPHPFKYLINCERLCDNVQGELFLIVYVHSALSHYKRRMVIRQTWGDPSNYEVNVRVVFVLGSQPASSEENGTTSSEQQEALLFESEQYGDITQEDFVDTYHNLTYKAVAALKWISNYCTKAKYVLKTDDDIFVQSFGLIARLQRMDMRSETRDILMCNVWTRMKVMRSGKWKVTPEEWNDTHYSTYCSGSAFIMSTDLAVRLHAVSYYVPFFWVDDFYVTGLLPLKLGNITHIQISSTYQLLGGLKNIKETFTGSQWFRYVFSHLHDLDLIQAVWRTVVQIHRGQIVPTVQFALPGHLPRIISDVTKPPT